MDILSFVASIVQSLAWPAALVLVLLLLRRPLLELLPSARRFKWNELEIEFERDVAQLKAEAKRALPKSSREGSDEALAERLTAAAALDPNRAVLEAWRAVEGAVLPLLRARHLSPGPEAARYKSMERLLDEHDLLDDVRLTLFRDLRRLRNKVRHASGFRVSEDQALEYVDVALSLRAALELECGNACVVAS